MLQLGPLAFAQPFLLLALVVLPVLWWLLRVTPPAPRRLSFPAIRLLLGLMPPEETPARTPWWLLALRLMAAACVILGLAQPLLNPSANLTGSGPLLLVVDDGWAAARNWASRQTLLESLLSQAERQKRSVLLLSSAAKPLDQAEGSEGLLTPQEARRRAQGLTPKPWPVDRQAVIERIAGLDLEGSAHVVWLSDGLDNGHARDLAERLQVRGRLDVVRDADGDLPHLLLPPEHETASLTVRVRRATDGAEDRATVIASGEDGRLIARVPVTFAEGEREAAAVIDVPVELRNRIARLHIEGETQAGAVMLIDERWRRRPVGLIETAAADQAQPLLSQLYYLKRALAPYTELREGSVEDLLQRELAVVVQVDSGPVNVFRSNKLADWVENGGLLLRFAGPRLAETGGDPLLPIALRGGGRIMGGVMTWDRPARLAPFPAHSPFAGLAVSEDVLIARQVLAEPTLELPEKTWAQLADGTPLVTAERRGKGWTALVHTTANNDWSNLPLSGLFVDMLRRLVALSQGVAAEGEGEEPLAPLQTLDGFGQLRAPPATVLALDRETLQEGRIGPSHPPGYYGRDSDRRALNLVAGRPSLKPIGDLPSGVELSVYSRSGETQLMPWLLTAALVLLLADFAVSLWLRGLLHGAMPGESLHHLGAGRTLGAVVLLAGLSAALMAAAPAAFGQQIVGGEAVSGDDDFALQATLETRFAYVETGVASVDAVSRAGLIGLTRVLSRRTSVEPGAPLGVDPNRDELSFFPLIYWPVVPEAAELSDDARKRVNYFLAHGGTILFDLREAAAGTMILGRASRGSEALMRLSEGLDIPPLAPVPPDHVLTKSFYLMQDFPGRYAGGTLWVGATEGRVNDGVASVMVGSNDWASAWAVDSSGRPLYAVVPGGERQRELAYRAGINLVMYALTGNYKADQVHVPFILERLGQ
ncbi:MAG: DUF4159 domain-containing protein [Kiloniellales bacterium]|nr:DUF4159 domain-containing protein [Kiloniellales bacterium]